MFEKLTKWFKSQPKPNSTEISDGVPKSTTARQQMENVANSEFVIKYNRHKDNLPQLNPIGRDLFLSDAKTDTNKVDTMAYIIHCPKHDAVAVYQDPSSGIRWLPFTPTCPDKYVLLRVI